MADEQVTAQVVCVDMVRSSSPVGLETGEYWRTSIGSPWPRRLHLSGLFHCLCQKFRPWMEIGQSSGASHMALLDLPARSALVCCNAITKGLGSRRSWRIFSLWRYYAAFVSA